MALAHPGLELTEAKVTGIRQHRQQFGSADYFLWRRVGKRGLDALGWDDGDSLDKQSTE